MNKFRILKILLKKDFIDGLRNWEIMIVVLIPVVMSMLMGFALSKSNVSLPKIAILSENNKNMDIFSKLLFKKITKIKSIKEGNKLLEKGKIDGVIILPKKLGDKNSEIKVILDDSKVSKTMMIKTIVEKSLNKYFKISLPIKLKFEKYRGLTPKQRMLPIFILMVIFMIGLTVIPKSISSEREKKTLDALVLTPVTEGDFLISKLVWGSLLMVVNTYILLKLNDGMGGNWLSLSVVMFSAIIASVGIGIFIATISPTESVASIISTFVLLIMILSSSIGKISDRAKDFTSFLPSYHLSEGFQKTALFNKDFSFVWVNILVLLIWGIVFTVLSIFMLKRKGE